MSPTITEVVDDEILYRRVRDGQFALKPDGTPALSARIFQDRMCRPSVYRERLVGSAAQVQCQSSDGVLFLVAEKLRSHSPVPRLGAKNVVTGEHVINVEHVPNGLQGTFEYAHAEIFLTPNTDHRATCRRMYEALAKMADGAWIIKPESQRP